MKRGTHGGVTSIVLAGALAQGPFAKFGQPNPWSRFTPGGGSTLSATPSCAIQAKADSSDGFQNLSTSQHHWTAGWAKRCIGLHTADGGLEFAPRSPLRPWDRLIVKT